MKFRNPETGEVFEDISDALESAYQCWDCPGIGGCPIGQKAMNYNTDCCSVVEKHAEKAARLMGYEVVEEMRGSQLNEGEMDKEMEKNHFSAIKEANMDKPLKDWTLEEVKECCSKHGTCVSECPFSTKNKLCRMTSNPCDWDLTDKPRWTQQEVEDAKTIKRVFGRDGAIRRTPNLGERSTLVFDHLYINEDLFPSIKPGQSYTLDEIIGGAQ